ncbi:double-cubane-cluster-containing anaerobic reductase [Tissierella creatinophila]|uniref:R-phenyllactate dehydratase beta subunit n=1 Tax=Tissierella creatinophila DSM 6911 TaxID=1123403 RepID=A0A1U7M7K3_TISCR|nr:double-cubane-cluster-containing anaerobic reductase [Tissierella creatinophila]OLS03178.1 R-phenyllactate dehydratase beta subunit [Tissierella creatinophila DSM 6911]
MNKLPEKFESYDELKRKGFLDIKELKESGKNVVGVFCTYSPAELVYAAGAIPVSLCGTSEEPIQYAERDLPKNLCPLIKSSYGHAVSDTCPFFYFSDLILGETTCDGKKKMYELLNEIKDTYVMQLPQNPDLKSSFDLWRSEIVRFKEKLEEKFDVEITEEKLREEIRRGNIQRKNMMEYFELGKLNPPALNGVEMNGVQDGFGFRFDREESNKDLISRTKELKENWEKNLKGTITNRPRILVTGCPVGGVREKILQTIELAGGDIVAYDNCSGIREKRDLIDETKDPIDAIAEKYLKVSCSVMSPNTRRIEDISSICEEFKVDAVIEVVLQACHTFAIEATKVRRHVNDELNLPYLYIESDYSMLDFGQIKTRIEAFFEMI